MARLRSPRQGVLVIVLALTACSSQTATPGNSSMPPAVDITSYSDVRAVLDPAAETITLPIDAYFFSPAVSGRVSQANALLWDECMQAGGRSYPPASFDLTLSAVERDRSYGIWDLDSAERWGYGSDPAADIEMNRANDAMLAADASDPGWSPAFDQCLETTERLPQLGRGFGSDQSLAISGPAVSIANDASMLASANPRWEVARTKWADCLVEKGLHLREGEESPWGPEVPEDPEAAIRTAVLDVQCKQETELVETLSSLEAQYQAALIDQNRAALDEVAEKEREIISQAEKILAEAGR